ncbi:hypothetical protein EV191_1011268 [Tamaricihabitans halophyticus]|uniref:Uncharacterized protein n=1 Tax=Tamaricihabitans halophyticus TaxID=1262583 RepID=A0A4R2R5N6_9PSEU|nr:hypothetical protein [Tamaricihabitans halophyticus]TCP57314.1 hypothetical protein EV191_1011268 [Tamaricihabitans halophyticus]
MVEYEVNAEPIAEEFGVAGAAAGTGMPADTEAVEFTDAELAKFEQAARDPDAPAALKLLVAQVDEGRFSWREIAEGKAFADPEMAAVFEPLTGPTAQPAQAVHESRLPVAREDDVFAEEILEDP